jgi:hypothetical protein
MKRRVAHICFAGWQVGSDPEIQVATIVSNHLTAAVLKYFGNASRWQVAANLFEKLAAREPEVSSLLARAYLGMSQWHLQCELGLEKLTTRQTRR